MLLDYLFEVLNMVFFSHVHFSHLLYTVLLSLHYGLAKKPELSQKS